MLHYDPLNWYWLASDGRLYSSAAGALIEDDDPAHLAWRAAGGHPTAWPADEDGDETVAALQAVLSPYGLFVALEDYAAHKRWQVETGGCPWQGRVIATDRDSQTKLIAEMVAVGAGLRIDGSPWKFADGSFAALSNAEAAAMIAAARAHIAGAFAAEADVLAGIAAGSITSRADIDAAPWPANAPSP